MSGKTADEISSGLSSLILLGGDGPETCQKTGHVPVPSLCTLPLAATPITILDFLTWLAPISPGVDRVRSQISHMLAICTFMCRGTGGFSNLTRLIHGASPRRIVARLPPRQAAEQGCFCNL